MKYYLHDSNSFNDEKVTRLYIKYGYEGLGLFYTILEKLAQQEKPVNTEVLKAQLGIGKRLQECWSFMEEIGIIHSNNGDTFNKQLLNFSEKYLIKKEKNRKKIEDWRVKQENVTSYEPVCNRPKDNISKVKLSKGITPITPVPTKQAHTPQALLIDGLSKTYTEKTGQPYKADRKDFVIASRLVSEFGLDAVVARARRLAVHCDARDQFFTEKDGWRAYSIGTISTQWNKLIPDSSTDGFDWLGFYKAEELKNAKNSVATT